jgi:26S proteasome non-ATPase regulatory subunit 10
MNSKS